MRKIIGLLIIFVFIGVTVLPVIGTINANNKSGKDNPSNDPLSMAGYIKYKGINGDVTTSLGLIMVIGNIGSYIMQDVDWTFDAEGGTIVFGDGARGRIPIIYPGEEVEIILRPLPVLFRDANGSSPIGFGNITLKSTATTSTDTMELTEDKFLIGPILLFF
jgi:hypothetical protein